MTVCRASDKRQNRALLIFAQTRGVGGGCAFRGTRDFAARNQTQHGERGANRPFWQLAALEGKAGFEQPVRKLRQTV